MVDNEGIFESTTAKYTLTIEEGNQYLKWNETTKQMEIAFIDATPMPAESELETGTGLFSGKKLLPGGTYIVAEDMTFDNNIQLSGDVNIILCDGKTLTINKELSCGINPSYPRYKLNIYGQSENTGKLIVLWDIYYASPLNVYGGQIDVTTTSMQSALRVIEGMNVYGGKINAVNNNSSGSGAGIQMYPGTTLTIYGGEVTAKGPAADDHQYGYGINGNVVVNDGKLVAISQRSGDGSAGIKGDLTVNGGSVEVKDVKTGTDDIYDYSRAAVTGTITLGGTGVSLEGNSNATTPEWTPITADGTYTYKHIRTK